MAKPVAFVSTVLDLPVGFAKAPYFVSSLYF